MSRAEAAVFYPEAFSAGSHRQTGRERERWGLHRIDLLRRLHTAMQYSSESKLLRLPAQPPYMKRTHFFWLRSKCQRGMEARQGPVSASREHTAARGQLVRSSGPPGGSTQFSATQKTTSITTAAVTATTKLQKLLYMMRERGGCVRVSHHKPFTSCKVLSSSWFSAILLLSLFSSSSSLSASSSS